MLAKNTYKLLIGRHFLVKSPDFLAGAAREAISHGANALMIYIGAPQSSFRRPVSELKVSLFKKILQDNQIDITNVVVHAPYLLNLANINNKEIFNWSVNFLKKEIARMEEIGLKTIVLHPGSALIFSPDQALNQIVMGINLILRKDSNIRIALETMCGRGNEVGGTFEQLSEIINGVVLKEKVGVCWDTCHLYNAGYDIKNNLEAVIKEFEQKIGLEKLWVIHTNDSLYELGTKKDRHENIGYGKIGLEALKKIVWHPKFNGIIKLLETPRTRNYQDEIKMLKNK